MRILIAEDDKEINRMISEFLSGQGYESGKEAAMSRGMDGLEKVGNESGRQG